MPPQPRPPVRLAARPPFASRWTMTLLADGVGRLDSARGIAWVQLSNGARNAVLKSVEGSEFFTTIRMATINNLYTNPLVYRFFGCDIAPQNLHPASVPFASEDSQIGVMMRVCLYGQDRTHPGSS